MDFLTSSVTKFQFFSGTECLSPPLDFKYQLRSCLQNPILHSLPVEWKVELCFFKSLLISFSGESGATAMEKEWINEWVNEWMTRRELSQAETVLIHSHLHAGDYWYKVQTPALWLLACIFICGGSGYCLWTLGLCLFLGNTLWV